MNDIEWFIFLSNVELLIEIEGSVEKFAVRVGVPYFTVHGWRRRGRTPRLETVRAIANTYGITIDALLERRLTRHDVTQPNVSAAPSDPNNT